MISGPRHHLHILQQHKSSVIMTNMIIVQKCCTKCTSICTYTQDILHRRVDNTHSMCEGIEQKVVAHTLVYDRCNSSLIVELDYEYN